MYKIVLKNSNHNFTSQPSLHRLVRRLIAIKRFTGRNTSASSSDDRLRIYQNGFQPRALFNVKHPNNFGERKVHTLNSHTYANMCMYSRADKSRASTSLFPIAQIPTSYSIIILAFLETTISIHITLFTLIHKI